VIRQIRPVSYLLSICLSLSLAPAVSGQILWDAPPLVNHATPAGISAYLLAPAVGDLGALVTFRHDAGPVGLGYRVALADEPSGDGLAFAGGVDVSGFLARSIEDAPLDLMWWSGAGVGFGDFAVVSIPVGLLVGWSGEADDVVLSPYGGGHVVLDISDVDTDNVDFGGAFDLGLDVLLSSGWTIRFGATFGDRDALAIGVNFAT
jgi:hypothetical protein